MKSVYKSKVDIWLVFVIIGFTLVPVIPILYIDTSAIAFCIVAVILVFIIFIISLLFSIKYIIEGNRLVVKCSFLSSESFIIDDIQSIKATRTFLSAPAASLDRLELSFRNGSVVISPKDKINFIKTISELCSHEIKISI